MKTVVCLAIAAISMQSFDIINSKIDVPVNSDDFLSLFLKKLAKITKRLFTICKIILLINNSKIKEVIIVKIAIGTPIDIDELIFAGEVATVSSDR